jgi:rhamnosyltransferase
MIQIAGVVILYNPDITVTIQNIQSYLGGLQRLFIYDNSEKKQPGLEESIALLGDKVTYHYFGKNEGISKRLNQAADKAIEAGFSYLLTMDQDSSFPENAFEKYLQLVSENSMPNVAQFGVNSDPKHLTISDIPVFMNSLITSGTIMDLRLFHEVGGFDEKLFIDFVDVEYSLRSVYKGYVNLVFLDVVMQHAIGFIKMGRSFKNFKKTPRILHSPIRVYYIVRNGLYLLFKVHHLDKQARKAILFDHMKMLKNDFLYNDHLFQVYKNAFLGIVDFLRNRMGKKQ